MTWGSSRIDLRVHGHLDHLRPLARQYVRDPLVPSRQCVPLLIVTAVTIINRGHVASLNMAEHFLMTVLNARPPSTTRPDTASVRWWPESEEYALTRPEKKHNSDGETAGKPSHPISPP